MFEIIILGSCSGTEPMPQRKHTSFLIRTESAVYWFDAGEGCSRTAHLMGVDLLSVRSIFISHPHIDHVGGLANLLWTIGKMSSVKRFSQRYNISLYSPCLETVKAVKVMLDHAEHFPLFRFPEVHKTTDGEIYNDGEMRVLAYHNHHLPLPENGEWQSFTYRIEIQGKSIVFSGDVGSVEDLEPPVADNCNYLLMETGHHKLSDICRFVNEHPIDRLCFVHHGRTILFDAESTAEEIKICKKPVIITHDRQILKVED